MVDPAMPDLPDLGGDPTAVPDIGGDLSSLPELPGFDVSSLLGGQGLIGPQAIPQSAASQTAPPTAGGSRMAQIVQSLILPILMKRGGPGAVQGFLRAQQQQAATARATAQQQFQNAHLMQADQLAAQKDAELRAYQQQVLAQRRQLLGPALLEKFAEKVAAAETQPQIDSLTQTYAQAAIVAGISPSAITSIAAKAAPTSEALIGKQVKKVIATTHPDVLQRWLDTNASLVVPGQALPLPPAVWTRFISAGQDPITGKMTVFYQKPESTDKRGFMPEEVTVNGKRMPAGYDPDTNTYYATGTKTPLTGDIQKYTRPPAGQTGEQLSEEGRDFAATQYRVTGVMPALGMGGGPERRQIINRAAAQARALDLTPAAAIQKQAAYKADASALTQIRKVSSAAESFETKALAQADLIDSLSEKVTRADWPLVNRFVLSGEIATGNTPAQLLANAILGFQSEYGKILDGSTGSVAAVSEGTARRAQQMISTALSKGTLKATVAQMRWEDRKSTRLNSSHIQKSRMPSSA